jgi:DNA-binding beta-propeller fold protein YncE
MSDMIRDDLQVDPRLDTLLSRALGRGGVTREQRQRHFERLGLVPRLGGSAGQWRAPVVEGRPQLEPTARPASALPRRRRQWAELAAAVLAVILVAALLVALFRDWGSGGDEQLAASREAIETRYETRERLYVVSHVYGREEGFEVELDGRVTAYDVASGDEVYTIDTGSQVDAAVSADGKRLFIAALGAAGTSDGLIAVDALTGRELWRTPLAERRLHWILSLGPTTLAVSSDGSRVYVQSTDGGHAYWITELDGETGAAMRRIETNNCRSGTFVSPDDRTLYVLCDGNSRLRAIDLSTNTDVDLDAPTVNVAGAAVVRDTGLLYIVGGNGVSGSGVTVVDMNARAVVEEAGLGIDIRPARLLRLVALSPDGSRLFIGLGTDVDASSAAVSSRQVVVFDTGSWQAVGRIATETPITGQTLAAAQDNVSVFASHNAFRDGTSVSTVSSILRLSLEAIPATFASREREEVLAVIASQVDVPVERPTPTPEASATREQLYVVSHELSQRRDALITAGRVSALNPVTGEEFWSVEAGQRIDAVLSPDGRRLFVADSGSDGDHLYALDTQTGRELWRTPINDRQWHKPGSGQSMLAVTDDGATVTVYSCEGCTGEIRSDTGRNWLQRFDAATGAYQTNLDITECRGVAWQAPEAATEGFRARPIYVICDRSRSLEIVDPSNGQGVTLTHDVFLEGGFPDSTSADAHVLSPDRRLLYLVSGNRLSMIDMTRTAATRVQLDADVDLAQRMPLLALSPNGGRLFIGSLDDAAYAEGRAEVGQVDVYDTSSWERVGQIESGAQLTSTAFATAVDGESVYGVSADFQATDDGIAVESTIHHLPLDGEPATVATRTNEEVLYLFSGTVEVDPATVPLPAPTPAPAAQERLFVVSRVADPGGVEGGRVTAYDTQTTDLAYWIETGPDPDAVLSHDGTRLYVAGSDPDGSGDILSANEALSGEELWSVPIHNRVQWMGGEGPTTLAVSQDGTRLFIYSTTGPGSYAIQVFDTADGRLGRVIHGVAGCVAQLFPSPDNRSLYVVCLSERVAPQVIDLETMTSAGVLPGIGGYVTGAAATSDGSRLYITHDIDTELRLTVIDTNGRVIADQRDIVHLAANPLHSLNLLALSQDGSRLFLGVGEERDDGNPVAREVWVWDTAQLHVGSIQALRPLGNLNGWSLAAGPDNRSVYAVQNSHGLDPGGQPRSTATISWMGFDAQAENFAVLTHHETLRLFSGRVSNTPLLSESPATEIGMVDKLTLPDGCLSNLVAVASGGS